MVLCHLVFGVLNMTGFIQTVWVLWFWLYFARDLSDCLSLVGSGKMFMMVILNQTVFESFWFKPDQASEFSFVLYTNVMHFLYSWQVQEKGSHYFSGEVSTNGKEQVVDGFFGPFGGGVLGKCQESSFSFKLKCHLTTFSFRMFQTRNYNVMKGDSMDLETPAMEI